MSRSFDWDTDTCRPVLDRSQILTSDVNWDEVHALLFVPCCLLPELAETPMKHTTSSSGMYDASLSGLTVTS